MVGFDLIAGYHGFGLKKISGKHPSWVAHGGKVNPRSCGRSKRQLLHTAQSCTLGCTMLYNVLLLVISAFYKEKGFEFLSFVPTSWVHMWKCWKDTSVGHKWVPHMKRSGWKLDVWFSSWMSWADKWAGNQWSRCLRQCRCWSRQSPRQMHIRKGSPWYPHPSWLILNNEKAP